MSCRTANTPLVDESLQSFTTSHEEFTAGRLCYPRRDGSNLKVSVRRLAALCPGCEDDLFIQLGATLYALARRLRFARSVHPFRAPSVSGLLRMNHRGVAPHRADAGRLPKPTAWHRSECGLDRWPFEAAKSIIHIAFASCPIVRSSRKSVCKTHTKRVTPILDLLN